MSTPAPNLLALLADIQKNVDHLAKVVAAQPHYRKLAIINSSKTFNLTPAILEALQIQLTRDFLPYWNIDYKIISAINVSTLPNADTYLNIVDSADTSGALGWHDEMQGRPFGEVFVNESKAAGVDLVTVISHEMCLSGDTRIPLLDGTSKPIKDLLGVKEFWVYACKDNGELRPGRAHSVRITQPNAEVVRVTLDNGESFRCTADHRIMMRDGTYREAQSLKPNDSLMPLYRKMAPIDKAGKGKDYEQVYIPSTDSWMFTHRMVVPYCSQGYTRHHKDFNRFNNSPDNLEVMTWKAHHQLHAAHIAEHVRAFIASGRKKRPLSEADRARASENGKAALRAYNGSEKHRRDMESYWSRPGVKEAHVSRMVKRGRTPEARALLAKIRSDPKTKAAASATITSYNKSAEHRELAKELGRRNMAALQAKPGFAEMLRLTGSKKMKALNTDPEFAQRRDERVKTMLHNRWHVARALSSPTCELCQIVNHKVVSVEAAGREDVYDLTVDKYHSFAIEAGVFVHNCELAADPLVNALQLYQPAGKPAQLYAVEVGDPVESDQYAITTSDGTKVNVSNFVTPAYFSGDPGPWDYMRLLAGPLPAMTTGGYLSFLNVTLDSNGWQQINSRLPGTSNKIPT